MGRQLALLELSQLLRNITAFLMGIFYRLSRYLAVC